MRIGRSALAALVALAASLCTFEARALTPKKFVIFFAFDKCELGQEAKDVLDDFVVTMKSYEEGRKYRVILTAHTDTRGTPAYNRKLSQCRADTAKAYLIDKGIQADVITTIAKGETELMVATGDGEKEPQNRRLTIDSEWIWDK